MFRILLERIKQKHRTSPYPKKPVVLPERFRGQIVFAPNLSQADCEKCVQICPTQAIRREGTKLVADMGKCIFCMECQTFGPAGAVSFRNDYRLATSTRGDLITDGTEYKLAQVQKSIQKIFGRSLKLRQVSAAGCNACEADVNVLNTLFFDLQRFGINFVASPRHADGVLVTGPVSKNMELALQKTYAAIASPKVVIAVGACAISGGIYAEPYETLHGISDILPVDLFIPGCPPHPMTILDGLLRFLGKLDKNQ